MEVEEFLEHQGVKGMRWGVRTKGKNAPSESGVEARKETHQKLKRGAAFTAAALAASGAVAVVAIRRKNKAHTALEQKMIKEMLSKKFTVANKHGISSYGELAVKRFFPKT